MLADGVCVVAGASATPVKAQEPEATAPSDEALAALADKMCACDNAACVEGVRIEVQKLGARATGPDGKRLLDCALRSAASGALDAARSAERVEKAELLREKRELERAARAEAKKRRLEEAVRADAKPVTVSSFKSRFQSVGRLLGRLEKVSPDKARPLKALYSSVQSNFGNALRDEKTRVRFHRTLGRIGSKARRHLRSAELKKSIDPFD